MSLKFNLKIKEIFPDGRTWFIEIHLQVVPSHVQKLSNYIKKNIRTCTLTRVLVAFGLDFFDLPFAGKESRKSRSINKSSNYTSLFILFFFFRVTSALETINVLSPFLTPNSILNELTIFSNINNFQTAVK